MNALLALMTRQPQLVLEHAEAYGEVVAAEARRLAKAALRQLLLVVAAVAGLVAALVLAGVALLLWLGLPSLAAVPSAGGPPDGLGWIFIAVPLLPLAGALACLVLARLQAQRAAFGTLREQVHADWTMLREMAGT